MNTRISSVHRAKFWMYFCRSMAVMSLLDHLSRISSELWRFYQHPSHFLLIQLYQEWPKTGTGWTITWDVNYPREGRNSFLQEIWKQFWSMPIFKQYILNLIWGKWFICRCLLTSIFFPLLKNCLLVIHLHLQYMCKYCVYSLWLHLNHTTWQETKTVIQLLLKVQDFKKLDFSLIVDESIRKLIYVIYSYIAYFVWKIRCFLCEFMWHEGCSYCRKKSIISFSM